MVGIVALRVGQALIPFGLLWIGKLIIETVEISYRSPDPVDWRRLGSLVALEFLIALTGQALARASSLLETLLGELFSNRIAVQLMGQAGRLDLAQLEDAETFDQMERARRQTVRRIGLLSLFLDAAQNLITIVTLMGALALYVPWLLLLLAVAVIPAFLGEVHFGARWYALLHRRTPERRKLEYLRAVAAGEAPAKEVKLFGLSDFLIDRYATLAANLYEANRKLSRQRAQVAVALAGVGALGYYGAYAVIIHLTVSGFTGPAGPFTIGVLTFLAGSFRQSRDLMQRLLLAVAAIYEESLYVNDLFQFLALEPRVRSLPTGMAVPARIREGFVFEDVSFRYPGAPEWAVRNLNVTLKPGETVALVGENGAGKTTIVKLLARLYDPVEGRILLDGVDLRAYKLDELRKTVGVVFQDFMRYAFLFRENITVGAIDQLHNNPRMREAARRSLADTIATRLENGYEQQLGRRFDGGVDLSGGEWQKLALARAYFRGAQVLILDEPTASLDARAEYEVFQRFADLAQSRLAVLISHRFSTVRMADRILVLRNGRLVEHGRHQDLVRNAGLYAELFSLQAAAYR